MKCSFVAFIGCVLVLLAVGDVPVDAGSTPQGLFGPNPVTDGTPRASDLRSSMLPQNGYIGLFVDVDHSICDVIAPDGFAMFEMYIWMLPPIAGIQEAELSILYPENVGTIWGTYVVNPDITLSIGDLDSGIDFLFGTCQMDWVWSHHETCCLLSAEPTFISVEAYPFSGFCRYRTCEWLHPTHEFIKLDALALNQPCDCLSEAAPSLNNVTVESPTVIHAFFDMPAWSSLPYSEHFFLRDKGNPADTIRCVAAIRLPTEREYVLTLEDAMVNGTTYVVKALQFGGPGATQKDSEWEFLYLEATGTVLQSYAAALGGPGVELTWELIEVDVGIEFLVSRSENGESFVPLDISRLERDGLRFRYTDSRIEPGRVYVYKVDYTLGGKSRLLFLSDEIRTPAAPLVLYQNRPNPFNPATTIDYYLPTDAPVTLDVYDSSGRLVSRLLDRAMKPRGTHSVEWRGLDAQGRAASSGVYFYRLTSGKETVSRKMVLLR